MRYIRMIFMFLLVFASACVPPGLPLGSSTSTAGLTVTVPAQFTLTPVPPTQVVPTLTDTPAIPSPTAPAKNMTDTPSTGATVTPTELPYTACGWIWATQSLPQLSALLKQSYQDAGMTEVEAAASAYGENCLDQTGKVNHFAAMETDFNLTVPVKDTKDTQTLGDWVSKLMPVIEKLPRDQQPGPNPGRVSIRFKGNAEDVNLSFARARAEELLQQGLNGTALFDALKNNP